MLEALLEEGTIDAVVKVPEIVLAALDVNPLDNVTASLNVFAPEKVCPEVDIIPAKLPVA
jgi:hypothetical protein